MTTGTKQKRLAFAPPRPRRQRAVNTPETLASFYVPAGRAAGQAERPGCLTIVQATPAGTKKMRQREQTTPLAEQLPVAKTEQVAAAALEQLDALVGLAKVLLRGSALAKLRCAAALEAFASELRSIAETERRRAAGGASCTIQQSNSRGDRERNH